MKRSPLIITLSIVALVAVSALIILPQVFAVGGEGEATPQATALTISLNEMNFTLDGQGPNDPITLKAGETYAITFVNKGTVEHEVMAGNGDLLKRANGTPHGYTNNFFDGITEIQALISQSKDKQVKVEFDNLDEVELDPGMSATITFTVPKSYAGQTFEIGCFIPGHYEAGMHAPLIIK